MSGDENSESITVETQQLEISSQAETEDDEEASNYKDDEQFESGEEGEDDEKAADLENKWNESFARLKAFKEEHGHCLVPNRYPEDPHLGSWVSTQRRQYKILTSSSAESTPMTPKRISMLQKIGFKWMASDPRHVPWETRYNQLVDFVDEFGHAQVPIGWKKNVKLSNWVSTQRQEFKLLQKGRTSRLSQEHVDLLNKVGFIWEAQRGGPRRKKRATVLVPDKANPVARIESVSTRPSISKRGGFSRGGSMLKRPFTGRQPIPVGGVTTSGGVPMLGGIPQPAPTGVSYQLQVVAVPTYSGFQSPPVAMAPPVPVAPSVFPVAQPMVQPVAQPMVQHLMQPMAQPILQPTCPLQPQQLTNHINMAPHPNQMPPPLDPQHTPAFQAPPSNLGDFFHEMPPSKRRRS